MSSRPPKRVRLGLWANSFSAIMEDNSKASIVDIHPDGDVILDVGSGTNARSLRVSSGVLTAASAFFVELFGVKIKENGTKCSAANPKHVPMDADDPQAVHDLCNILHYRSENVKLSTGKQLVNLALLCDKYDCRNPIKLWMDDKMSIFFRSALKSTELLEPQSNKLPVLDVMALAYLFDNSKHFWLASRPLIDTSRLSPALQTILPAELLVLLQRKRQNLMTEICKEAENEVAGLFEYSSNGSVSLTPKGNGSRPSFCKPTLHKFGFYMGCLTSVGIWPCRYEFHEDPSVEEILEQLVQVSREPHPGTCSLRGSCISCRIHIGIRLAAVVKKHKANLTGLCLGCVKKGDYTDKTFRETCQKHGLKMGE